MNPIEQIDFLAKKFLNNQEYTRFADLLISIDRRLGKTIDKIKTQQDTNKSDDIKNLRYPHDIEINIIAKLFRNNQIGERVELIKRTEIPILKKLGIPDDPQEYLNTTIKNIINMIES